MNSRERVRKTLNHEKPDKVPVDFGGFVTSIESLAYEDLKNYLKFDKETYVFQRAHVDPHEEILEKFNVDTRYLHPNPSRKWDEVVSKSLYQDEWGITWEKPKDSYYFDMIKNPLVNHTYEDLKNYQYPDLWNRKYEKKLANKAESLYKNTDYFIIGDVAFSGIFEQAWALRGMENFFMDLLINKDFAKKLLDIVLQQRKDFFGRFLDVVGPYVDMVTVADDLGTQDGCLISPDLYREIIKPRHKELHDFIKNKADVKIFFHCCGAVRDFIDDLVEIGVDVLNPVQCSARGMNSKKLKNDFGDRIVFWGGGCDTQKVLQFGTPEEVRTEVKEKVKDFMPGGGFVFTQVHHIQPGTPPKNIVAMFEAIKDFRNYNLAIGYEKNL